MGRDYSGDNDPWFDVDGHGTHVAGIIGAQGNNGIGVVGVCWDVELISLRVYDADNSTSPVSRAITAINYANNVEIPILNYSNVLVSGCSNTLSTAIKNYYGLFVCSAGNGKEEPKYSGNYYPINIDGGEEVHPVYHTHENLLAVTSTTSADTLYSTHNYGIVSVDLGAPGITILSTYPIAFFNYISDNAYVYMNGTSMAAPYVTGVAALIKSIYPKMDAVWIKAAILNNVDPVASLSGKTVTGGRLNAYQALVNATQYTYANAAGRTVSGDFDGDGDTDMAMLSDLGSNRARVHVWRTGYYSLSYQTPLGWAAGHSYNAAKTTGRVVSGDFDGDGKDDIAAFYDYGGTTTRIHVWKSTGTSFAWPTTPGWWSSTSYTASKITGRVVSGDFNGDGKDDIAAFCENSTYSASLHVWLSTGSSFTYQGSTGWWTSNDYKAGKITDRVVCGDFNGDGKDDIAALYDYGTYSITAHVWISQTTTFSWPASSGWWSSNDYRPDRVAGRVVCANFAGDGKDDIAMMYDYGNNGTAIHLLVSSGTAFGYQGNVTWWSSTSYNASANKGRLVAGNVTGGSRADIIAFSNYGGGDMRAHVWSNIMTHFTYEGAGGWWRTK